jgi:hypothetical protein
VYSAHDILKVSGFVFEMMSSLEMCIIYCMAVAGMTSPIHSVLALTRCVLKDCAGSIAKQSSNRLMRTVPKLWDRMNSTRSVIASHIADRAG